MNMTTLLSMLNACECREDNEDFKNAVDLLFDELEKENPDHFAVRQYRKFKMAGEKTLKKHPDLLCRPPSPFDIKAVRI